MNDVPDPTVYTSSAHPSVYTAWYVLGGIAMLIVAVLALRVVGRWVLAKFFPAAPKPSQQQTDDDVLLTMVTGDGPIAGSREDGACAVRTCDGSADWSRPRFEQVREDTLDRDRRRGYKPREFMRVIPGGPGISGAKGELCRLHHDRAMSLCEQWNEEQRMKDVRYATEKQRQMHAFERWGVIDAMEREIVEDGAARQKVDDLIAPAVRTAGAPTAAALVNSTLQPLKKAANGGGSGGGSTDEASVVPINSRLQS